MTRWLLLGGLALALAAPLTTAQTGAADEWSTAVGGILLGRVAYGVAPDTAGDEGVCRPSR